MIKKGRNGAIVIHGLLQYKIYINMYLILYTFHYMESCIKLIQIFLFKNKKIV